jgi:hypothetical protein
LIAGVHAQRAADKAEATGEDTLDEAAAGWTP